MTGPVAGWLRRFVPVAALGLTGVASLLLQPIPPGLRAQLPLDASTPDLAAKLLLVANPAVLLVLAALAGAMLAHRAGLGSVVAATASTTHGGRVLGRAAAAGFALGLALALADTLLQPALGQAWQALGASASPGARALVIGLLYGGLAEEVMLRWGLMSLLAWALGAIAGGRPGRSAMTAAVSISAAVFAAAHLPGLAVQVELTAPVVARTLLLNTAAGLLYGWLFWRHHLEAAMAAHAATHLGLAAWRGLAG